MPDVMMSDSDWGNISGDDQSAIMSAVSQTFGYNVASSGGGASFSAMESAATAQPAGTNAACDGDCKTIKENCLGICAGFQDPKSHDGCVTACWAAYGICFLECAVGI